MPVNRQVVKEEVVTYAKMLFTATNDKGGLEAVMDVYDQLGLLTQMMNTNLDLAMALSSTEYEPKQRYTLVKAVFADAYPTLTEVLAVMAERGDMPLLHRIRREYIEVIGDELNTAIVDVTTVVSLDDDLRKLIKDKAAKDLGRKIVLREHIDPSILGGIIMSTGGKRIDASVLTQLNRARHVLKETPDGGEN